MVITAKQLQDAITRLSDKNRHANCGHNEQECPDSLAVVTLFNIIQAQEAQEFIVTMANEYFGTLTAAVGMVAGKQYEGKLRACAFAAVSMHLMSVVLLESMVQEEEPADGSRNSKE